MTFSSGRRLPLFHGERARRAAVRQLARVAGPYLALFCIVDDHVHVLLVGPAERIGFAVGALYRALGHTVAAPLDPPHRRPVESRAHLEWLLAYLLGQSEHHALDVHPALWSGSCFADLVGARLLPGYSPSFFRQVFPRVRQRDLCRLVKLPPSALEPAPDAAIRGAGAARLPAAAAAALAIGPQLDGKGRDIVRLRAAVLRLGAAAGTHRQELRWALEIAPRTARRLASLTVPDRLLRAIRVRISLDEAVSRR